MLTDQGKDPAWSPLPDGPIAFVRATANSEELWLIEPDGSHARKLGEGGFPSWSRDGRTVYGYHQPTAEVRVFSVDDPSAPPRTLWKNTGTMYPAVSPDCAYVVVRRGAHGERLAIIDIASGEPLYQIATPGWDGVLPSWSPDGRYLAFGSYAVRDETGLCVLDLKTGEAARF